MTKLSDMPKALKSNHQTQIKWLDGQIAKNNRSIFLNPEKAEAAYNKLNEENMGQIEKKDLEKFVARYLSESGIKKIITTIRVAETRAKKKGFKLQCNIEFSNNQKLEKLMKATGMNKGEVINKLIELANINKITKKEEQLEITL